MVAGEIVMVGQSVSTVYVRATEQPVASVAVMVTDPLAIPPVAVPVMLLPLMPRPGGSEPLVTWYVYGSMPPVVESACEYGTVDTTLGRVLGDSERGLHTLKHVENADVWEAAMLMAVAVM